LTSAVEDSKVSRALGGKRRNRTVARTISFNADSININYEKEFQSIPLFQPPPEKFRLIESNLNKSSEVYFIKEYYNSSSDRLSEINYAISKTAELNPNSTVILVISDSSAIDIVRAQFYNISYDAYFVGGEVNYGTTIELGNYYPGIKIVGNTDDLYPAINFTCKYWENSHPVVYAFSRFDDSNHTCTFFSHISYDALMYNFISKETIKSMQFSRDYWGCENVVATALKRDNVTLFNMCPYYYPLHVHKSSSRSGHRIRIDHKDNHIKVPASDATLLNFCTFYNETTNQ
jgi:hypothetical protein